jgi:hypothetical protein
MATLAVFIALGGVSYAAVKLPKNSVGSAQLKNNAVTLKKIAPKARKALIVPGAAGAAGAAGTPGANGHEGVIGARQLADVSLVGASGSDVEVDIINETFKSGSYVAIAKVRVLNEDAGAPRTVGCAVYSAGFYADSDTVTVAASGSETMTLTGGIDVSGLGPVRAYCGANAGAASLDGVDVAFQLTMIPAGSISYEGIN